MQTPIKLAGFAVGLATVFGAAAGLGSLVGPIGGTADTPAHSDMQSDMESDADATASAADIPGGLMVSQDGYTLELAEPEPAAGEQAPVAFRILGPDGTPVTDYTRTHGEDLHLIAVRRDLTGFQHVHPELASDGTWDTELDLVEPGDYRVFTDFTPAGSDQGMTLGADLSVAGAYDPQPLPEESRTVQVEDYTVTLEGDLVPGEESELTLSVSRDGEPVTDLQPYLEAYGHLVVLRDGDLAYLHVHPDGSPGDGSTQPGPDIKFYADVPSSGDYRLFLDFRHGDQVRTADFTASAGHDEEER